MINRFFGGYLTVLFAIAPALAQENTLSDAVTETLKNYAAAIESKNMKAIEKYVVTSEDFTIFEEGHINWGWPDYRDNHFAPELKAFLEFQYNYKDFIKILKHWLWATWLTRL